MFSNIVVWIRAAENKLSTLSLRVIPVQPEGEDWLLHNLLIDHVLKDWGGSANSNLRPSQTLQGIIH